MNRPLLEQPFSSEIVKSRKGSFGEVSYVEAVHYIRRLNDAFDGRWTWRIVSYEMRDTEVIVHGVLEADGVARHAFGGGAITASKTTGEVVSIADDLKSAATDALKKACSLLGIGLDLYGTAVEPSRDNLRVLSAPAQGTPEPSGARATDAADRSRLTAKQLKAIYGIAHAQGLTDNELKRNCKQAHGMMPEFLSREDASAFISSMTGR